MTAVVSTLWWLPSELEGIEHSHGAAFLKQQNMGPLGPRVVPLSSNWSPRCVPVLFCGEIGDVPLLTMLLHARADSNLLGADGTTARGLGP